MGEPAYGDLGLDVMRSGLAAAEALTALKSIDPHPERRQVAMIDGSGEIAVYTGEACIAAAGHRVGEGCVAVANMMQSDRVWDAMVEAYEVSAGPLAARLMAALQAAGRTRLPAPSKSFRTGRPPSSRRFGGCKWSGSSIGRRCGNGSRRRHASFGGGGSFSSFLNAHPLFSGKIQGNLPIWAQGSSPDAAFAHVDQWVGRLFPKQENRELFRRSREHRCGQIRERRGSRCGYGAVHKNTLTFIVHCTISLCIRGGKIPAIP